MEPPQPGCAGAGLKLGWGWRQEPAQAPGQGPGAAPGLGQMLDLEQLGSRRNPLTRGRQRTRVSLAPGDRPCVVAKEEILIFKNPSLAMKNLR